jgi:transposase
VRRASQITLSNDELGRLRRWMADPDAPARLRERAKIILWAAAGHGDTEIAEQLGRDPGTISLWRRRFLAHRLSGGLRDAPRPGRKPNRAGTLSDQILDATYNLPPSKGHRWTTRTLARHFGVNHMLVHRVWKSQGIGPRSTVPPADRLSPRSEIPFVDLLGVVWRPPTRVVLIGVDLSAERKLSHVEPLLQSFRTEISGGYLLHSIRADPEDLIALLEGFEGLRGRPSGRTAELGDLLILLRDVEERTTPSMRVHILADRRVSVRDHRLAQWLRSHPRFVYHALPSDSKWAAGVRGFLRKWHMVPLTKGSFQGISAFARSAARFAAAPRPPREGLVWSVSQAIAMAESLKTGEISVTELFGESIPMPPPPTKSISTSEIGAIPEKYRLRTEGP